METFGQKISAEACSGKEIAGLLKKMMLMIIDDDDDDDDEEYTKIEKSRMSGFSRGKLEAGRNELGLCTARHMSLKVVVSVF